MTPDERWLDAVWPVVRAQLPGAPGRVVELGCGPLGGFVPMMRSAGYEAVGVDPEAPEGAGYFRGEFERYEPAAPAAAIVACTSLHHVAGLPEVLDRAAAVLAPGGLLVVVEWDWERFDEATARWCFGRLPPPGGDHGWLHGMQERWRDQGGSWEACLRSWAREEGLHTGGSILREVAARFPGGPPSYAPYFFPELAATSEADEQAAIDSGQIRATRIQYTGRRGGG